MTDQGSDQIPNKDDQAPASTATASTINRPWLIRIVVIVACLVGYAAWSLYDAFVAYPERGESYASWTEWQYLGHALEADSRESPGILRRDGAVADPVAELERLKSDEVQERNLQALQGGPRLGLLLNAASCACTEQSRETEMICADLYRDHKQLPILHAVLVG